MKTILTVTRYLVGILFIFSGLIKANDPLGLSYKMQEFFEVWGLHNLNDYTLAFSVLMIAFEIIAGVAVLIGWQMRLFSWLLLLLIIFFTFLTGYALFSGKIKTCGCFGDCIPLTADQSFVKDLVLLAGILLLFVNRNRIKTRISSRTSILILLITTVFSFGFQWYVLNYLPVLDCLPYKKGARISEQMKIPAGAIPDSTVISFVYNKAGKELEFTADQFPDDFDESVYSFVRRYDKLIRKGNAEPKIKDFVLLTPGGTDTTQAIINQSGEMYWLFIQSLQEKDKKQLLQVLDQLAGKLKESGRPVYVITPVADVVESFITSSKTPVLVLRCDAVAVKTAARYPATLYKLVDGVVVEKKAVK
ncbi:BT_3928 family protein [Flavihumibacter sp. CACIAM 22H1]|uniref:BT_3928 family protein n=1 Tax=Flavihumibacter sp. CACIAM 22H1 TaxID=1812911 RepID=UPI0007A830EB|nr:BT_3928 family protein [Flavihumibacter sp. CACIAM 22H1]KYP14829.1 MAG: DoxX family protein [Flavihumibacter sp. CACIAM 22H1]